MIRLAVAFVRHFFRPLLLPSLGPAWAMLLLLGGGEARGDVLLSRTAYGSAGTYSYMVPASTIYLVVKVWGAGGGATGPGGFSYGGMGGYIEGLVYVTPGTTYSVLVGAGGGNLNGAGAGDGGGGSQFGYGSIGFGAGGGGGGSNGDNGWWYSGDNGGSSLSTYPGNGDNGTSSLTQAAAAGGPNGQSTATFYSLYSAADNHSTDSDWASPIGLGAGWYDFDGHSGQVVVYAYGAGPPSITSSLGQRNLGQNEYSTYTITGSNSPTSFGASSLPPGLSVNTATGVISGYATTPGTYSSTISATNPGGTTSATLVWVVTAASIVPNGSVSPGAVPQGGSLTIYRDASANFGVAYCETVVWRPDGSSQYLGAQALGSSTYSPGAGLGTYTIQFRVVDNYSNYQDQWISFDVTPQIHALPYTTGFEAADGFTSGSLHGQQGWVVPFGTANVSTEQAQGGSYGVKLTPSTSQLADVKKYLSQTHSWAFVDVYARPVAAATVTDSSVMDYGASRIGFVISSGQGAIYLYDGNGTGSGTWVDSHVRFPINGSGQSTQWIRLTVRHDYSRHKWDLYVDGLPADYDCGMVSNAASGLTDLNWWGHATAAAYFDNFTASETNPLFTDADHDGMADSWETAGGLDTATDDRDGDHDGDGRSNVREYFEGTDPNNADVTAPTAPTSLAILATLPTSVSLAWNAGADAGSGVAGYNVYRNGTKLNSSLLVSRNYTDTSLSAGTSYSYTIRTVDAAGNVSDASVGLTIATPASSTSGAVEIFSPLP